MRRDCGSGYPGKLEGQREICAFACIVVMMDQWRRTRGEYWRNGVNGSPFMSMPPCGVKDSWYGWGTLCGGRRCRAALVRFKWRVM